MATKSKAPEQPKVPTFEFRFFRSTDNPREFTSQYLRDGVVAFEVTAPNSYQFNAAVMERKMRLAVHE